MTGEVDIACNNIKFPQSWEGNLSQTCVFQGGFDKKHQVSIVPKLDYLLYIDWALVPEDTAPGNVLSYTVVPVGHI